MLVVAFVSVVLLGIAFALWATGVFTVGWSLYNSGEGGAVSTTLSYTYAGNNIIDFDVDVDGGVTNQQNGITIETAGLKFLVISASKDVTLKTNSSSAPNDTINIKAGVPWEWNKDSGIPVGQVLVGAAGVITSIFHTNAGVPTTDKTTVKYRGIQDV